MAWLVQMAQPISIRGHVTHVKPQIGLSALMVQTNIAEHVILSIIKVRFDMNTNPDETECPVLGNRLLNPEEVAKHLGISRSFAYQLLHTGAIPTVRLGKVRRVRPQDLETYIQKNLHP